MLSVGDDIRIMEIDDRDSLNTVSLGSFPDPRLFWETQEKVVYILSDDVLSVSEKVVK